MNFTKEALLKAVDDRIAGLEKKAEDDRVASIQSWMDKLNQWRETYADEWSLYADAIKATLAAGKGITKENTPRPTLEGRYVDTTAYYDGSDEPPALVPAKTDDLKTLKTILEQMMGNASVSHTELEKLGFKPQDIFRSVNNT